MFSPRSMVQGYPKLRVLSAGLLIFGWWALSALHTGFAVLKELHSLTGTEEGVKLHTFLRRHGLMGPVGNKSLHSHVRVIIRAHPKDTDLIKSLVWGLRSQSDRLASDSVQVDFVLVPTEPTTINALKTIVYGLEGSRGDIKVLELDDQWFERAKASTPPQFKCTEDDRRSYAAVGPAKVHKICGYDNYVYYLATDAALEDALRTCGNCTHLLVSNGDNAYAPGFLEETLRQGRDLVITDFVHEKESVQGSMERGHLDLGGVLFSKRVLLRGDPPLSFLRALPETARALEVHDADYWFAHRAMEDHEASFAVVHKLLFYHH